MRSLLLDHRSQRSTVEHVDHVAAVRHLHGWCIGVAVDRYDFHAKPLQLNNQLLAKLAAATEQDARSAGRQWCTYSWHGILATLEIQSNPARAYISWPLRRSRSLQR